MIRRKIPVDALGTLRNNGIHVFVSPKYSKRLGYARYQIRVRGLEFEVGSKFLLRQLAGFLSVRNTRLVNQNPHKNLRI
jgi:hypothetical protein